MQTSLVRLTGRGPGLRTPALRALRGSLGDLGEFAVNETAVPEGVTR